MSEWVRCGRLGERWEVAAGTSLTLSTNQVLRGPARQSDTRWKPLRLRSSAAPPLAPAPPALLAPLAAAVGPPRSLACRKLSICMPGVPLLHPTVKARMQTSSRSFISGCSCSTVLASRNCVARAISLRSWSTRDWSKTCASSASERSGLAAAAAALAAADEGEDEAGSSGNDTFLPDAPAPRVNSATASSAGAIFSPPTG